MFKFIIISDHPVVKIEGPPYILLGKHAIFACKAASNPLPSIRWSFKPCLIFEECPFEPILDETKIIEENLCLTSLLNLTEKRTGVLKCEAENSEGSDYNLQEIVISGKFYFTSPFCK